MPSKLRIFKGFWTESDVLNNPDWLFIFGDNNVQLGCGGQAVIRNCSNAMGIPTKKYPSNHRKSFYSDNEISDNRERIANAIELIKEASTSYKYVIFPRDGFGTGLARLEEVAPKTNEYLKGEVADLKRFLRE